MGFFDGTTRTGYDTPMNQRHRGFPWALLPVGIALLIVMGGCSAQQEIVLRGDGSGTASVEVRLDPVIARYVDDLNASFGGSQVSLFDEQLISQTLDEQEGITVVSIERPDPLAMDIELRFDSIEDLLQLQGEARSSVRYERTDSFQRLAASIDRGAIEYFARLARLDPLVRDTILPPRGEISAAEYRDQLAWAFEEYAYERPMELVFRDSVVTTTVRGVGEALQIRGGEISGGAARFSTPMIEAITTVEPLVYSVVFEAR